MTEAEEVHNAVSTLLTVKKFLAEGKYWDIQLRVGDKLVKCQRSLLAANSEFFDEVFTNSYSECSTWTSKDKPFILPELDAIAFEEILHFIYTNEIRISDSNVYQLLLVSELLRLCTARVMERCIEYVRNRCEKPTPISDALDLLSFAHTTKERRLIDILTVHICQHLHHYSEDAKLMEIPLEYLNALLEFSKDYIVSLPGSQNVVLKIIHNWVNHDRNERRQHRSRLMKNINFSNVSSDFVSLVMSNLDNFADKVTALPKDTHQSLKKLKKLKVELVQNLNVNHAQIEANILFAVKPLELKNNEEVFSPPRTASNLLWKIGIKRVNDDLGVYLYCEGTSLISRWNCYACAVVTLVSDNVGEGADLVRIIGCNRFSSDRKMDGWGFHQFLKWSDLVDAKNGYIDDGEDGSIILDTLVYAEIPFY